MVGNELNEFEALLASLCENPEVVGAVLCDDEGEMVATSRGPAELPVGAEEQAVRHMPSALSADVPAPEFLLRLGSAETCGPLRLMQRIAKRGAAGEVQIVAVRYRELDVLVHALPEDFYVVVFVRRPNLLAGLRARLEAVGQALSGQLQ
ncbi:MAG: hypothetical protein AAGJ19_18610 [Myxococcota bacterium]